ncbi:peptide deformylase, mitochondrial-like [Chelonus insularis]|uniref:peptide deformylase, mitochondrial-like n=1 Tax=Chelonus insularis TaxID=460826 RepID=UPI00158AE1EB|nr:peptide deformylase, mitochondrial-like [Chelonus insularis]
MSRLRCILNSKYFATRSNVRNYSPSKIEQMVLKHFEPVEKKPPYNHICQAGDPVLRLPCRPVHADEIKCDGFQKFVNHLISVMRKYEAFGLAAPQIGMPIQVIVIETTKEHCEDKLNVKNAGQPIEIVPLQVFINPKMKILDFKTTEYPECCASILGFSAHVPRAKRIKVDALDVFGNPFTWEGQNWSAKLVQHEIDHLRGILYVDKMDSKTFSCTVWDHVNRKEGKIAMDFYPIKRSKLRKYFFI